MAGSTLRDVVVFWKQNDTGLYGRRVDMVAEYLASRPDVRRVFVFDAPLSEERLRALREAPAELTQHAQIAALTRDKVAGRLDRAKQSFHVFVYPSSAYRVTDDGSARPHVAEGFLTYIQAVLGRFDVDAGRAVFWVYPCNPYAPWLIDRLAPARVVADVVDDQRAWPGLSEATHEALTRGYAATLQRAGWALANCASMAARMRGFFPEIRLVPNGCEVNPQRPPDSDNSVFREFAAWPGQTIGFVGNLEAKIDIALVARVARAFPACQVVLVGSTHANPQVVSLRELPNVRLVGVVPYRTLGAWLSRFDVAIIPHLDSEMTRAMNPLKLYVYLAWRIPVVSTAVANVDDRSGWVRTARNHDEFVERIGDTLNSAPPDPAFLDKWLDESSWAARLKRFVDDVLTEP